MERLLISKHQVEQWKVVDVITYGLMHCSVGALLL